MQEAGQPRKSRGPTDRLERVPLRFDTLDVDARSDAFMEDARREVSRVREALGATVEEFVPSAVGVAYHALATIDRQQLATGRRFCEWGSGLGAVTGVAELLGFQAHGIEICESLVAASRRFLRSQGLNAKITHGSYKPDGIQEDYPDELPAEPRFEGITDFHPVHFDLIYAFPWPKEEWVVYDIFRQYAPVNALLLTYHGPSELRLHRRGARPQA